MTTNAFCHICVVIAIGGAFGYDRYPHWGWLILCSVFALAGVVARLREDSRMRASKEAQ